MTRFRMSVALVALVLLGAVPATAQTAQQERLAGVTEAYVSIEVLDDDSASCGITETGLTTAASKTLLDNGIGVIDESIGPMLYVNVNTVYFYSLNLCVSSLTVELKEGLYANPRHSAQRVFGWFMLATTYTEILSSLISDHGQRIRDMVFEAVEAIAVDIRLANQ